MRKAIFGITHMTISIGLLISAFIKEDFLINRLLILSILFILGLYLYNHIIEISELETDSKTYKKLIKIEGLKIIIGTSLSAAITWYINHKLGYGAVIASGSVGIIVNLLFSSKEAGAYYAASFVGMSGDNILPSMAAAGLGGLILGIIIVYSAEIYTGIGGKGGTMAAASTQIIKGILSIFI